jgi:DNA-binding GntR family transcriptional regulator
MTISKAYGYLVEGGLVERRPGVGLFVLPLDVRRKRDVKRKLLAESLGQSAALAVQLGLDEQTAVEQFVEEFTRMKSELENDSEN